MIVYKLHFIFDILTPWQHSSSQSHVVMYAELQRVLKYICIIIYNVKTVTMEVCHSYLQEILTVDAWDKTAMIVQETRRLLRNHEEFNVLVIYSLHLDHDSNSIGKWIDIGKDDI